MVEVGGLGGRGREYIRHLYMEGKEAVQKLLGEHQLKESGLVGMGQERGISLMSGVFMSLSFIKGAQHFHRYS